MPVEWEQSRLRSFTFLVGDSRVAQGLLYSIDKRSKENGPFPNQTGPFRVLVCFLLSFYSTTSSPPQPADSKTHWHVCFTMAISDKAKSKGPFAFATKNERESSACCLISKPSLTLDPHWADDAGTRRLLPFLGANLCFVLGRISFLSPRHLLCPVLPLVSFSSSFRSFIQTSSHLFALPSFASSSGPLLPYPWDCRIISTPLFLCPLNPPPFPPSPTFILHLHKSIQNDDIQIPGTPTTKICNHLCLLLTLPITTISPQKISLLLDPIPLSSSIPPPLHDHRGFSMHVPQI